MKNVTKSNGKKKEDPAKDNGQQFRVFTELQEEYKQKYGSFSVEEMRIMMNALTEIKLCADKIAVERDNVYVLTDKIKIILHSHDKE